MKIAVLKEGSKDEARVAISHDAVKKYIGLGASVTIEAGAGKGSSISDQEYKNAGASVSKTAESALKSADIILSVQKPDDATLEHVKEKAILIGMLDPFANKKKLSAINGKKLQAFSMEFLPRISRAQSMDVLSSQSNLAGYRAVIDAAHEMEKAFPMMMTAAGTVAPAKVLVLGAGVAGLQAIATAKRLGALVSAFDVRPAVKEQVESLGAKFVEVPVEEADAETEGGYAREMSEAYKKKQAELIHETAKKSDIIITTALIPGKPAPVLIPEETVKEMKAGSVVVDLAVNAGGNCPLAKPDKIVESGGVKIVGYSNVPSRVAADASHLYARNLLNFVTLMVKEKKLDIDWEDELIAGTLICKDGKIVHPNLKGKS
jgi:NAD(P) transhydrogenase subunit alpha